MPFVPRKYLIAALVLAVSAGCGFIAAYRRGFDAAAAQYEAAATKQELARLQAQTLLREKQEERLAAVSASYAALQSETRQNERAQNAKLEAIAQTAGDIYRRDCFDARGLQFLNGAIKGR